MEILFCSWGGVANPFNLCAFFIHRVMRLTETGLINRWYDQHVQKSAGGSTCAESSQKPISAMDVLGAFYVGLFFLLLAFIILLGEIMYCKIQELGGIKELSKKVFMVETFRMIYGMVTAGNIRKN